MDEFNSRMSAQRAVLSVVNRTHRYEEELCGLSRKAIERWISVNRIVQTGKIATILHQISSKLFFLASKSQEQVTSEYRLLSAEVAFLCDSLREAVAREAGQPI